MRNRKKRRRLLLAIGFCMLATQFEACYYMQAARGHMDLMKKRRPIDEVISDDASAAKLVERLRMIREARDFSIDELLLPDNESYRSYADLERDFVVWNIFAAPEFSLEPKEWCYPVAGCVAYRGYFSEDKALRQSKKLQTKGYDTSVGGVAAYSTLGRFSDPVLNTMMRWSDVDLVATLFHELAHQSLYIKGDTAFNESYATAVADIGMQRWLASTGSELEQVERQRRSAMRQALLQLVEAAKLELGKLYSSDLTAERMREEKSRILNALADDAEALTSAAGVNNWLKAPLNNARLTSLGLYEGHVSAFKQIYRQCQRELECFYQRTAALSSLPPEERASRLQELADEYASGITATSRFEPSSARALVLRSTAGRD